MAVQKITTTFGSIDDGGYDVSGDYYGASTDAVFSNFASGEVVFYAFDTHAILKAEAGLTQLAVTVTYTLKNADISTQNVDVKALQLPSAPALAILRNGSGNFFGGSGDNYNNLYNGKVYATVAVKNTSVTQTTSLASYFATANPQQDTFITFAPNGEEDGFTFPSNVTITVSGYLTTNNPTISGTVADQAGSELTPVRPFSTVTLTDPGNPTAPTDEIQISILLNFYNGGQQSTDRAGTLTGPGLSPSDGNGNYTLSYNSIGALQAELRALVFTPAANLYLTDPLPVTFELDVQSGAGGATSNQSTTVDIAPACYATGTAILTADGERQVEALAIGDMVVTASGRHRAIKWIGRRSYAGRFLRANPGVQPIRFRAGSLGGGLPRRDLLVSPEHAMLVDGVLIPARCLVNGSTIAQERGLDRADYFHVELDSHDVLLAEGAASESFMDDDSRGVFHNAAEFAALYPDATQPDGFCAPRVEQGAVLETIRRRLADIAAKAALAA